MRAKKIKSLLAITGLLLTFNMQAQTRAPQYVSDFAKQYHSDFLAKNKEAVSSLTFRFFYNEKGDAVLEATVVSKNGYTWSTPTWNCMTWPSYVGGGSIGWEGVTYRQTRKNRDAAESRMEQRRRDAAFAAVEKVVLQIATEYDYDYAAIGRSVKYRDPNVKKAVCDGYADATVQAFEGHPLVDHVEKWTGGNHAWNVVVLKDGRKIYTDTTWYDGSTIDEAGYATHVPVRSPIELTFDLDEFNSYGFAIDTKTNSLLKVHFAESDVKRVK